MESLNRSKLFIRELTDRDGNVVCQYHEYNESVRAVRYKEQNGSLLPITVITHDQWEAAHKTVNNIKAFFFRLYPLEICILLGVFLYQYWKTKK